MDQKNNEAEDSLNLKWGCFHITVFFILIVAGIVTKRVFGHPEYMMLYHGPAAVFLVVGGMKISAKHRRHFKEVRID